MYSHVIHTHVQVLMLYGQLTLYPNIHVINLTITLQLAIFSCIHYLILSFFRYRLCVQQGWDRFGEDLLQTPHTPVSQGSNIPSSEDVSISPPTCRWKNIYMRALSLDKNWAQGRYSVAPLLRGHKEPITCMTCDSN